MKVESQTNTILICPICNRTFNIEAAGVVMPFCSIRCKQIDTKRWLNEEYGLPYESIQDQIDAENEVIISDIHS
ncbi:MAG: DNA gyrase inhibitor YacG [Planctomycetaceae bacterium]|jgi:endogenous inhibitor of DNA gyrase (YacG/DUF329 family)|nr:DNA gyrase inhibitor YacG [Planctomycetaceae bacterium]